MSNIVDERIYDSPEFKIVRYTINRAENKNTFEYAVRKHWDAIYPFLNTSFGDRFIDMILQPTRRAARKSKNNVGALREIAKKEGLEGYLKIKGIGPARAKFLYELFKPE